MLRNVVGITFQAGEGGVPAGDQMTIRGFSARTDMFVDGVRDFGGYARDPFNVEQVEVAKGPASVIAGRGSTGGAINMVSKTPRLDSDYAVSLGAGNADFKRTTLDINQPIEGGVPGTAFRVNAMWTDAGVPGRDAVESARWGVAPSLAMGLGTPTRLTAQLLPPGAGQPAGVRAPVGAGQHQPGAGRLQQRRAAGLAGKFLRSARPATTRTPSPTSGRCSSIATSARASRCAT